MTKYRNKPVEVEAWQVGSDEPVPEWIIGCKDIQQSGETYQIATLEGVMIANLGDYIIQGVKGELYPCKPDIFEQTYGLAKPYYLEVYDWASYGMEGCDEPEFTMLDEICTAIGKYCKAVR